MDKLSLSDQALAVNALMLELQDIESSQLDLATRMSKMLSDQALLAHKSKKLTDTLKELLNDFQTSSS